MSNKAARLLSRPTNDPQPSVSPGLKQLGLGDKRDGYIYIPRSYEPRRAAPMVLALHGAGGDGRSMVPLFKSLCDHTGTILVAVDSRGRTWDGIRDGYGPDIEYIDKALSKIFSEHAIDARHVAVVGFSDGASYALSIGITNGDLFPYIIAYSPGFMSPPVLRSTPKVFISHGVADTCLNIDRCSRRIIPKLQDLKLTVTYHEFEGGHTVPESIAKESFNWFLGDRIARSIMSATAEPESGMERA